MTLKIIKKFEYNNEIRLIPILPNMIELTLLEI